MSGSKRRRYDAEIKRNAISLAEEPGRSAHSVERANVHLKDWLWPSKIMAREYLRVSFTLMAGVLCLVAMKIPQHFISPTLDLVA